MPLQLTTAKAVQLPGRTNLVVEYERVGNLAGHRVIADRNERWRDVVLKGGKRACQQVIFKSDCGQAWEGIRKEQLWKGSAKLVQSELHILQAPTIRQIRDGASQVVVDNNQSSSQDSKTVRDCPSKGVSSQIKKR